MLGGGGLEALAPGPWRRLADGEPGRLINAAHLWLVECNAAVAWAGSGLARSGAVALEWRSRSRGGPVTPRSVRGSAASSAC